MKKVLVFGPFDHLHARHLNFFSQAKKLGDYLIVVVATDTNVTKAKGSLPKYPAQTRLNAVLEAKLVDKALLGSETMDYLQTIKEEQPALIALGYDQKFDLNELKKELEANSLGSIEVIRLKPHQPHKY